MLPGEDPDEVKALRGASRIVPIAAGEFYPFRGLLSSPIITAAAKSFGSVSVATQRSVCGAHRTERKDVMKNLVVIGFAVGTVLAGCASTGGERPEPTAGAVTAPAPQHEEGNEGQAGMMAGMCPMHVAGTTVAATEVEGGIGLSFTTTTGDVVELRQRVRAMAEMHAQRADHAMKMPAATATAEEIEDGARLILQPEDAAQLEALRQHVRAKAQGMADGECPMMGSMPHGMTMPTTANGAR